jgi:hypothetical protein
MRHVQYIANGFGNPVNYHVPGPMGNQFASPYGDPYRIDGVGFSIGGFFGGLGNILGGIGKIATPLLPGLVQVGAGLLLNKTPQQQQGSTTQSPSQSQFTQASTDAQAQQAAAAAEKANMVIYVTAGAVALFVAYYFISKRRR